MIKRVYRADCYNCGKNVKNLRRGFCINCYRELTGLSGGKKKQSPRNLVLTELKKIKARTEALIEYLEEEL